MQIYIALYNVMRYYCCMDKIVALYCRTSTSYQNKGLESQERALVEYCAAKGITNYKIYKDEGISGSKASRPELDKMLLDIRAGDVASVIVYSFSRFARSTQHLLAALEEFRALNVSFVSVSENLETESAIGKALFVIISAISELEREILSERVRNGLNNAVKKGKKLGRKKQRNSVLIRELANKNYSQREIAKLAGCSKTSVQRELKKSGGHK